MTAVILQTFITGLLAIVWYLGARCFVSGSKLPFLGFLQCLAYPGAALSLLQLPFLAAFYALSSEIYSKGFQAAGFILSHPELANDPVVKEACANPAATTCIGQILFKTHPYLTISQAGFAYVILIWDALNASTIIKGVTGLERRRTLAGLILMFIILLILFIAGVSLYVISEIKKHGA